MVLFELLAKIFLYLCKVILKVFLIVVVFFLLMSYTPIGENINMLKERYYYTTGKEFHFNSVLSDLNTQANDSIERLNDVSNMMYSSNKNYPNQ